jgi:hypothetical protein
MTFVFALVWIHISTATYWVSVQGLTSCRLIPHLIYYTPLHIPAFIFLLQRCYRQNHGLQKQQKKTALVILIFQYPHQDSNLATRIRNPAQYLKCAAYKDFFENEI